MLDFITPPDELISEAQLIDDFLNITCSDNPAEMVERGNELTVYMARTGKMLADAKYHLDEKMKSSYFEELKKVGSLANIPATTINTFIKVSCSEENYLVNWIERMNRTCTHQIDWLRTCISKAKEEARQKISQ